jgi:hypothetical protein
MARNFSVNLTELMAGACGFTALGFLIGFMAGGLPI